jgi:L-threonylcarbamoyladenylate synthase
MTAGPEDIALALSRLRAGGLVAFPTETVYGLGADAFDAAAVERVFALKGRPATNPLIVHVSGEAMARSVVAEWTREAATLARTFWPGPLTIVLPKSDRIPGIVTAGGTSVGVRCPDHLVTLSLLEAFGPLVGPSANPSGRVSPTTAAHVRASFTPEQVLVLDGGPCRAGIESTVVSLVEASPRVLRPGVISAEQLSGALKRTVAAHTPGQVAVGTAMSPGLLESHYAPHTPARLVDRSEIDAALKREPAVVVLTFEARATPTPHTLVLMPSKPEEYAARLYAALREADEVGAGAILIERPPTSGPVWQAIADRLGRAARF